MTLVLQLFLLLFRNIFAITELLLCFDPNLNFGTETLPKFAKHENPELK